MKTLITASVAAAAALLRSGQTVIFPTETVYGLGADALNPAAVKAVFEAKRRPADNPLIVHIWQKAQIEQLAQAIPDYAYKLCEAFFPGPFTILLPKRELIPAITTAGSDKVCLRMPDLPLARQFIELAGCPVAAPSANLSGRPSPTRWEDCVDDMDGRVGAILQGPAANFGLESTIVDGSGKRPALLRPGAITFEQLQEIVPDILPTPGPDTPITPGTRYRHYAPQAQVMLLPAGTTTPATPRIATSDACAYIGLSDPDFPTRYSYKAASVEDYAHNVFSFFRECDRRGMAYIFAEEVAPVGLGRALMNRLHKAAAQS